MCMGGGGGRGFLTLLYSTKRLISILINANHKNLSSVFHLLFFFISSHLFLPGGGGILGLFPSVLLFPSSSVYSVLIN